MQHSRNDMKTRFIPFAIGFAVAFLCFGCASAPKEHTYWLENKTTGTFTAHRTFSPLSPDEISELGFVEKLPEGAKVVD